ncbi:MAG TPA: OPT family oligopeptide transporter [Candidatus Eisenbacteria bacterium]|nr:OPT family oligopeptide transporter [Candidatus Eisenbacteria bacterium]
MATSATELGTAEPEVPGLALHGVKPAGAREMTPRAIVVALIVAAVIGGSYPYIVMKLGFGPNISVVSAFFGYLALGIAFRNFNRWENNIVQTAGTSAGSTAFLCVLMAAFDLLRQDPQLHFAVAVTPLISFCWLTCSGVLGVLLAVPMRRHFVVDEKLTYADGVAAAETLVVLDSRGTEGRSAARSMGLGTLLSGVLMAIRADARLLGNVWFRIPELLPFGKVGAAMNVGVSWSLLSVGSGMIVGMRINASMLLGTLLAWVVAPPLLVQHGWVDGLVRRNVLLWVMWPATGMLIAGGLTALALRWRILVRTFRQLSGASIGSDDFPMRWVAIGAAAAAVALAIVQRSMLGTPVWMTGVAIVLSLLLMLVGLRVLGETNWGPISALSNMMQAIFGVIAPGQVAMNMVGSGVTGSVASQSEGLMQDYKTGYLIGSTPRLLTIAQLLAVPVGAATVSLVYPLLRDTYGLGGDHGLQSPISQKWAGFAKLLSQGPNALPHGAIAALVIAVVLGVLFTVLESTRWKTWTPSPTGIGIGMLVPGSAIVTMFLGGLIGFAWEKAKPDNARRHTIPLASGFIAGEAIVAVLIPILVTLHVVKLQD